MVSHSTGSGASCCIVGGIMTTVFEQPWNISIQTDTPMMARSGVVIFQKYLKDVIPSPLPLPVPDAYLLHPNSGDFELLATLMQAAYGLQDNTSRESRLHMRGYFLLTESHPALSSSWMCFVDGLLVSACLVALPHGTKTPYIVDWMTAIPWQGKGLGKTLLQKTLHSLVEDGFRVVRMSCTNIDLSTARHLEKIGFSPFPGLTPKN